MSRVPRLLGCLAAVALVAALAGCGHPARKKVASYLKDVATVEATATPALNRAQAAYRALGSSTTPKAIADVARAERDLRTARDRLAQIPAPPDAKRLRALLLVVYDRQVELAHETTLLARYEPAAGKALAPLPTASKDLQKGLGKGSTLAGQEHTLKTFAARLRRVVRSLGELAPPPVLRATHDADRAHLRDIANSASDLRAAMVAQDAEKTSTLAARFQKIVTKTVDINGLMRSAVASYDKRIAAIADAQNAVQRERTRLDDDLK